MMTTQDIGYGVKMENLIAAAYGWIGILVTHRFPGSRRICSTQQILFDLPKVHEMYPGLPTWRLHSLPGEPLTLWPAIYCEACRRQGFVFEGQWLPDD